MGGLNGRYTGRWLSRRIVHKKEGRLRAPGFFQLPYLNLPAHCYKAGHRQEGYKHDHRPLGERGDAGGDEWQAVTVKVTLAGATLLPVGHQAGTVLSRLPAAAAVTSTLTEQGPGAPPGIVVPIGRDTIEVPATAVGRPTPDWNRHPP